LHRWRPNHETFLYPFLPAHSTRPKELKKLYLIQLPSHRTLSVPKNMKLLAVPLFELYDNTARYGPQLSAIPHYLSRYRFEFVGEDGRVERVMPGGGPGDDSSTAEWPKVKILAEGAESDRTDGKGATEANGEVKMEDANGH
jgi:cleavage and polyadenylation specificity factor subunit 5